MFWGIIAAGFLGGVTAVKNTVLGNWVFLASILFSSYISILCTPEIASFLKDFKEIPESLKGGGVTVLLFILLMILCHKIFYSVTGEEDFLDDLPEKLEKSFNFVCGFFSGMLLATLLIFCAFLSIYAASFASSIRFGVMRFSLLRKLTTIAATIAIAAEV